MRGMESLEVDKLRRRVRRMSWHPDINWENLTQEGALQEMRDIRDLLVAAEMVQRICVMPGIDHRTANAGDVHVATACGITRRLMRGMPKTDVYAVVAEDIQKRLIRISTNLQV